MNMTLKNTMVQLRGITRTESLVSGHCVKKKNLFYDKIQVILWWLWARPMVNNKLWRLHRNQALEKLSLTYTPQMRHEWTNVTSFVCPSDPKQSSSLRKIKEFFLTGGAAATRDHFRNVVKGTFEGSTFSGSPFKGHSIVGYFWRLTCVTQNGRGRV